MVGSSSGCGNDPPGGGRGPGMPERKDSREESEQYEVEVTAAMLASLEGKVWPGKKTLMAW